MRSDLISHLHPNSYLAAAPRSTGLRVGRGYNDVGGDGILEGDYFAGDLPKSVREAIMDRFEMLRSHEAESESANQPLVDAAAPTWLRWWPPESC